MIVDWKSEIVAAVAVQQACMRVDLDKLWDYSLPEVRASEQEIARVEKHLGFRLPEQYRSFLLCADGWENFYQDAILFGTKELLGGYWHDEAQMLLETSIGDLHPIDYDLHDFFPIGTSETQIDLFVIGKVGSRWEGQVIWIAGYIMDEYPSFLEAFRDIVACNKIRAQGLAEDHHLEGEPRFEIPVFDDGE